MVTFITSCHAQVKLGDQRGGALVEFRILGPVVLGLHGEPLELGSVKERIVLAALAMDVGRPVALDHLISRLWDGDPPLHARESAHSYISRLRGRLRLAENYPDPGGNPGSPAVLPEIVSRSHTYLLRAPADSVDWHRFQSLTAAAGAEPDDVAVRLLLRADGLWQGEALAGLPGLWAETVRRSLSELRLAATVSRTAAQLRLGQYAPLTGELPALVEQFPQNETLLGHLTLAYYGSGRFGESLRVQQSARQMLWREYGARPGPELDRLHHGILDRRSPAELVQELTAPGTGPITARGRAVPHDRPPVPRTLPRQHPLVGRIVELEMLTATDAAPSDGSVILLETVSGMPGVGKTAVAVHTAEQLSAGFPGGQLYLDLRGHSPVLGPMSAGEALTELLRMLGAPASAIPLERAEQVSLWRAMMAERRAVVVLDDAASAAQVEPLLPDRSPSVVIVTSRRHLIGLAGTRSVTLDTLPLDDAVELFRSFAGRDRTRDEPQIAGIVIRCGLLPLAIELVANRFRTRPSWTVATLGERLSRDPDRLAEIRDTERDVARAFELSYQTLTDLQRRAFRRLSLHPGADFTPDVAAEVLELSPRVTEQVLEELLGCHLLREPTPDRYRYHDLVREFARQVAASEDEVSVRSRVLDRITRFYLHHAETADRIAYPRRIRSEPPADGPGPHVALWSTPEAARGWLARERANLLATEEQASAGGDPERAARLGYALAGFLEAECHWRDAGDVLRRAAAHWSHHGPAPSHCRALLSLAASHTNIGNYPEAEEAGTRALEIARATDDSTACGEALLILGTLAWSRGDTVHALEHYQRSLAIKEASGDRWGVSRLHSNMGVALLFLGEDHQASSHFTRAISGFKESGDLASAAAVLNNTGDQYLRNGELDSARLAFEESLAFLESAGNRFAQATVRSNLADVLMELGDTGAALDLYQETLHVFQELGDKKSRSEALIGIGEAHRATGDLEQAVTYFREALEAARTIGAAHQEAQALRFLGRAEFSLAQLDAAAQHLRSAATTSLRFHDLDEVVEAHTLLADVLVASGDTDQALTVLRTAAEAVADHPGHRKAEAINLRLAELTDRLPFHHPGHPR